MSRLEKRVLDLRKSDQVELSDRLACFPTHDITDKLWDKIQKCTTQEQLNEAVSKFSGFLTKAQTTLSDYTTEQAQMKEMIVRFDEVLSQKVSKETFANLETHLHTDYLPKIYLDKELTSFSAKLNDLQA